MRICILFRTEPFVIIKHFIFIVFNPEKVLNSGSLCSWLTAMDTGEGFVTCINVTCTLDFCHLRLWSFAVQLVVWRRTALTGILLHKTACTTRCRWRNSTGLCFYCHRLSLIPSIYKSLFISFSVCSLYWANKRPLTFCSRAKNLEESSKELSVHKV